MHEVSSTFVSYQGNVNQNYTDFPSLPSHNSYYNGITTNVDYDVSGSWPSYMVGGI